MFACVRVAIIVLLSIQKAPSLVACRFETSIMQRSFIVQRSLSNASQDSDSKRIKDKRKLVSNYVQHQSSVTMLDNVSEQSNQRPRRTPDYRSTGENGVTGWAAIQQVVQECTDFGTWNLSSMFSQPMFTSNPFGCVNGCTGVAPTSTEFVEPRDSRELQHQGDRRAPRVSVPSTSAQRASPTQIPSSVHGQRVAPPVSASPASVQRAQSPMQPMPVARGEINASPMSAAATSRHPTQRPNERTEGMSPRGAATNRRPERANSGRELSSPRRAAPEPPRAVNPTPARQWFTCSADCTGLAQCAEITVSKINGALDTSQKLLTAVRESGGAFITLTTDIKAKFQNLMGLYHEYNRLHALTQTSWREMSRDYFRNYANHVQQMVQGLRQGLTTLQEVQNLRGTLLNLWVQTFKPRIEDFDPEMTTLPHYMDGEMGYLGSDELEGCIGELQRDIQATHDQAVHRVAEFIDDLQQNWPRAAKKILTGMAMTVLPESQPEVVNGQKVYKEMSISKMPLKQDVDQITQMWTRIGKFEKVLMGQEIYKHLMDLTNYMQDLPKRLQEKCCGPANPVHAGSEFVVPDTDRRQAARNQHYQANQHDQANQHYQVQVDLARFSR